MERLDLGDGLQVWAHEGYAVLGENDPYPDLVTFTLTKEQAHRLATWLHDWLNEDSD